MINELIETLFTGFKVDGQEIPVSLLNYQGHGEPYIVYSQYDKDNSYSSDDDLAGYIVYYDFEIYSKGNIYIIIEAVKKILREAGFTWQPRRDSPDFYEPDTEYYHKTVVFAYPIQEIYEEVNNNEQNN